MYVDFHCGGCESQLTLDADDNSPGVWMLVHRFANSHVNCGFVTAPATPEIEATKTTSISTTSSSARNRKVVRKPRIVDEDE